jgi:hypothetical protein
MARVSLGAASGQVPEVQGSSPGAEESEAAPTRIAILLTHQIRAIRERVHEPCIIS